MKKIKSKIAKNKEFGKRLASIRKARGFTQYSLADALGISNRMVAYYEAQTDYPPTHLLPKLSKVLKVSADELLGIKPIKNLPLNGKLFKKFQKVEKFSSKAQKKIIEYIDDLEKVDQ